MAAPFPSDFSWLPEGTALVGEYGSRAHGTDNPESDRDFHALLVEPREFVTGLSTFTNLRHSTAGAGQKSSRDDFDTTVYAIRKWARDAAAGNPNMFVLLHLPRYEYLNDVGQMLLDQRRLFVSKQAAAKFIGYLTSQKKALLGERGARVQRPDLVAKHLYDIKFAYHMVKVGLQGLELMRHGRLTIPFEGDDLTVLRGIRAGEYTLDDVIGMADNLVMQINAATEHSRIVPDRPNYDAINALLDDMYRAAWAD
jgi:predicted nucleotidyltransferase